MKRSDFAHNQLFCLYITLCVQQVIRDETVGFPDSLYFNMLDSFRG
jgi:hypothetical protein